MRIFKACSAIALAFLLAGPALADGPAYRSLKDAPEAPASWSGIYLGMSVGWVRTSTEWRNGNPALDTGRFSDTGFIGGGTLGANWQIGSFVLGAEADASLLNAHATTTHTGCSTATPCKTSLTSLATVRGRVGYLVSPSVLVYGTGGGAWGQVGNEFNTSSISTTQSGWVVGGGVEGKIAPRWTLKGEYLHVDLGSTFACGSPACTPNVTAGPNRAEIVRMGLNYKF
ncbi:MAG: porin family protein [Hyphomicrobiales bacterium]|nr:MAG: porin family protein [Hyphomicrobiales bacterium]